MITTIGRHPRLVVLGTLLAVAAAACGGGGGGGDEDASRVTPTVDAATATTSKSTTPKATTSRPTPTSTTAAKSLVKRVFAAGSPWYRRVPTDAPSDPGGFAYGQALATTITTGYRHAALNTTKYSPAVYTVPAGQPARAVAMWNCQNKPKLDDGLIAQLAAVPIPDTAVVPPDSDAHVVVWQPSADTLWEMWKTRLVDGQWQACWGGKLDHASQSDGTFAFPYGATATGISLVAGLVTLDDLRSGRIDHAIALGVDGTRKGVVSWPANRTDGRSVAADSVVEGQRLRLDPTVDVASLPLTPLGRMLATALQQYGAIVRDTTLGSVTVYAENSLPVTPPGSPDPYGAFYGGKPKYAQLDGIPWDRLVALPVDYGEPGH